MDALARIVEAISENPLNWFYIGAAILGSVYMITEAMIRITRIKYGKEEDPDVALVKAVSETGNNQSEA